MLWGPGVPPVNAVSDGTVHVLSRNLAGWEGLVCESQATSLYRLRSYEGCLSLR
jgi:hypothetical protein